MFQPQKQNDNMKKTQSMLKSYNVFFLNDLLFLNFIFVLFLVCLQQSKMLRVCQVKIYINYLSSKSKRTTQKYHEKNK
jgi:hypothetical protein